MRECFFKKHSIEHIDYRDVDVLNKFLNQNGQIMSRKITGVSAHNQRKLQRAIKRARFMALLPYTRF